MVRRILLLLLPSRMQIQIPLMQMGSSSTRLFSCAVQELHFLGQETLVSSFSAWSVSPHWPKSAQHRLGVQQSRNSKGKPAKTHHANWTVNWKCRLKLWDTRVTATLWKQWRGMFVLFSAIRDTELWSKPRTICPTEGRMCFHCSSVMMNRVTTDENMRKISTLLVKSYNDFEQLSCTDQLERRRTNICSCGPESSQKYFKEQQS